MIITIDGPAGSGKSTVAQLVAQRLGYRYLDSGAMYRALTWQALQAGIHLCDSRALTRLLSRTRLTMRQTKVGTRWFVNGRDVTRVIRAERISQVVNDIAAVPVVRHWLHRLQRRIAQGGEVVAEGRDMGTVVFPRARWKFFLVASFPERVRRRMAQLHAQGHHVSRVSIARALKRRDARDRRRTLHPLRPAPQAIKVDSTQLAPEQTVAAILHLINPH
ncbi:MAG: (d)CMP kinase [Elusimicrobia bacterium]|nr:(d)CMP kinase [Elusimicrobiota bacterium]